MTFTRIYRDVEERLLANSIPEHCGHFIDGEPSECWLWVGNLDDDGYGRITSRIGGKHKKVRAHRAAYETFLGVELGADETLDHLCRVRRCIHPNHVEPVAREENSRRRQDYWRGCKRTT